MRLGVILLTVLLIASSLVMASEAQTDITPVSLTLTVYSNGVTQVDYYTRSDPTKVRVYVQLFGDELDYLIVRDEDSNPLQVTMTNETVRVDSIGAIDLYFSYRTKDLTSVDESIWLVNITSPVNVTIILPEGANLFDMNNIPTDIGAVGDSTYLVYPPGNSYVYYILGLPSVADEANASYVKAEAYILEKTNQGYLLTAAEELLLTSLDQLLSGEYIEAKQSADDALLVATDLVGYAIDAQTAINEAEALIEEADQQGRTIGLETAEATLQTAKNQYSEGLYRNAEITAQQAMDEANSAEKPDQWSRYLLPFAILAVLVILVVKRESLGLNMIN